MYPLATTTALAFLFLPGLVLHRLLGLKNNTLLSSMALGISLLVISQVPVRVWRLDLDHWLAGMVGFTVAGAVLAAIVSWCRRRALPRGRGDLAVTIGTAAVALGWSAYHACVGGYSEVPSDFWNHLHRIRWEVDFQRKGGFIPYDASLAGLVNRDYVHALHALVTSRLGVPLADLVEVSGYLATLLFLLASYGFAVAVFRAWPHAPARIAWTAAVSVMVLVAFKGVTVFSFVRYYAMAPAMLGFIVYYAFLAAWQALLDGKERWTALAALAVFGLAMGLMHQQELAFAVVVAGLVLLVTCVVRPEARPGGRRGWLSALLAVGLAAVVAAGAWLVRVADRGPVVGNKLLNLADLLPGFDDVFVLNPGFQFIEVLGVFGIAVLVVALWHIREFRPSPLLLAGLLVPLVTVFNPLFVYTYLHLAKFETVWRFLFVVPVSLFAGYLLVSFALRLRTLGWPGRCAGLLLVALLAISLLPVQWGTYRNVSRLTTLVDTRAEGVDWLRDVAAEVAVLPVQSLYTDPVTSYVLRASTRHHVFGWKFYKGRSGFDFAGLSARGELAGFLVENPGIYVVNRRDRRNTPNGWVSGHWYADVLTVSKWYPASFAETLVDRGARLVYRHDGVEVYLLVEASASSSS